MAVVLQLAVLIRAYARERDGKVKAVKEVKEVV